MDELGPAGPPSLPGLCDPMPDFPRVREAATSIWVQFVSGCRNSALCPCVFVAELRWSHKQEHTTRQILDSASRSRCHIPLRCPRILDGGMKTPVPAFCLQRDSPNSRTLPNRERVPINDTGSRCAHALTTCIVSLGKGRPEYVGGLVRSSPDLAAEAAWPNNATAHRRCARDFTHLGHRPSHQRYSAST